jgi:membrane protease subunit HflK
MDNYEIKMPHFKGVPKQVPKLLPTVIIGLFILIGIFNTFYTIEPEQEGVVMRFGKFRSKTNPGLHWKIPFGIDSVIKVPVQRQLKEEFGFRTIQAGVKTRYDTSSRYYRESLMLTGDLNVADVEWTVQYKIRDSYNYLFKVRIITETLRDLAEAVTREVIGDRSVDEVITIGRTEIAAEIKRMLQEWCNLYETGIDVQRVVLQDVNPPEEVKASFNEVNQAEQERERMINEARAEYNKEIPKAKGEAERTIRHAEGYALDRINRAKGETERFLSIYEEYRKVPRVTRQRLYLETMRDVLPAVGRKIIVDPSQKTLLPLLDLNPVKGGAK